MGDAILPGNSVRGLLALALALHAFGGELEKWRYWGGEATKRDVD